MLHISPLSTKVALQFTYGFLVLLLISGFAIASLLVMNRTVKRNVMMYLFNSGTSKVQMHLYFGMLSIFSLFVYTAFATLVDGIDLDISSLGKAVGIIFFGIGVNAVGNGLQVKTDYFDDSPSRDPDFDTDDPTEKLAGYTVQSNFFLRLFDSSDRSFELHLVLGALALLGVIFYEGYDLAFVSKEYDPESYGYSLAYAFVGIGAAGWGQGLQRKFESEADKKKKSPSKKKTKVKA
jgi:hypothetical protein